MTLLHNDHFPPFPRCNCCCEFELHLVGRLQAIVYTGNHYVRHGSHAQVLMHDFDLSKGPEMCIVLVTKIF